MSWYSFFVMVAGSTVEASDVVDGGAWDEAPVEGTERPGREVRLDVVEGEVKAEAPWCMDASMARAYCFGFETDIVFVWGPLI